MNDTKNRISVFYIANTFAKVLSHGCAIYDDGLVSQISSLQALQAGWKFFGRLNNDSSPIQGIEGWEEDRVWGRMTLSHTTGSGRLNIVVHENILGLKFTAGSGDVVLYLSINPSIQRVDVLHLNKDLIVGREDRLDSLYRFNARLGGLLGDWLKSSMPADQFLFELIGGSERFASEVS